MAKPKTKKELLESSQNSFNRLNELIDTFSSEELNTDFPQGTLNRNIRDVLAHLHEWNLMFLGWYEVGMKGEKPDMPAKGYTWKTLPDLNKAIRDKYKHTELNEARGMLNKSFNDIQKVIEKHSDKELFTKKKYHWTGSTSLGSYLVSTGSSHYNWAYKLIKRSKK